MPVQESLVSSAEERAAIARRVRGRVVEMSHRARTPHLGSSLSCVDILVAAYFGALRLDPQRPEDAGRDRFILSKGHAATALYAVLAERGFCPAAALDDYAEPGAALGEHPSRGCLPGVEVASGSLGHGLSLGLGLALAGRLRGLDYRVMVCLSDGECDEGTVWEAALLAAAQHASALTAVIDYNQWQATGRSNEVMALDPLADKWTAFGWRACEVDGHDIEALVTELSAAPDEEGRPTAIVAHTVKGKGVSFMEDDNNWHYRIPNAEEVDAARRELGLA
jgi:transketolase